jgi:hypothetical protein
MPNHRTKLYVDLGNKIADGAGLFSLNANHSIVNTSEFAEWGDTHEYFRLNGIKLKILFVRGSDTQGLLAIKAYNARNTNTPTAFTNLNQAIEDGDPSIWITKINKEVRNYKLPLEGVKESFRIADEISGTVNITDAKVLMIGEQMPASLTFARPVLEYDITFHN